MFPYKSCARSDCRLGLFSSTFLHISFMKRPDFRLEQSGAVLERFPLQILYEKLRKGLITDWSWSEALSFTRPLRKGLITHWSWSEAFSFTNPGASVNQFPPQRLDERTWKATRRLDYRLELVCSTPFENALGKGVIVDWSQFEAPWLTNYSLYNKVWFWSISFMNL